MAEATREAGPLRAWLVDWLRRTGEEAGSRGFVFGLSGGIDSAVVCALAAEAAGPEACLGLVMPIESSPEDARDACATAERFGVHALTLDLTEPFEMMLGRLGDFRERAERLSGVPPAGPATAGSPAGITSADALARANLKPRMRMSALYYYANLLGYMVLGTGNRDEFTVGYYTKFGDGAADAFPLGDLVKAEIRALGRLLGVPAAVLERPPSAGLWAGQTDEEELGFSYDQLDRFLLAGSAGDAELDAAIESRRAAAAHKAARPPVARPPRP